MMIGDLAVKQSVNYLKCSKFVATAKGQTHSRKVKPGSPNIHLLLITCSVFSWQLMVKHSGAEEHDGSEDEEEVGHLEASGVCLFCLAHQRFQSN